jgi:hypothetical protein
MTTPHDPTIANTAIWSHYLQEQWGRWLAPPGSRAGTPGSQIIEGTAARVASFLTLMAAGPIAWLYATSAAERGAIVTELPQRHEAVIAEEAAA